MFKQRHLCLIALLGVMTDVVLAEEGGVDFRLNGFGTLTATTGDTDPNVAQFRTDPIQFEGISDDIDFSTRSKLGVQGTAIFSPKLSATAQILAKRRGNDAFDPDLEWLFVSYQPTSWLDLRAGRMVLPAFLVSDYRPVGFSQTLIEAPVIVYSGQSVTQFDGFQMINKVPVGSGTLTVQTSLGDSEVELLFNPQGPSFDFNVDNIVGINATYELGNWLWRYGTVDSDTSLKNPIIPVPAFEDKFSGFGIQYDNGDWLVMAERLERKQEPAAIESIGSYITVGKRFGKWMPFASMAEKDFDITQAPGVVVQTTSESETIGVRYDWRDNIAFKFQWDQVAPDSFHWLDFDPLFFLGTEKRDIYGVSVDFIF